MAAFCVRFVDFGVLYCIGVQAEGDSGWGSGRRVLPVFGFSRGSGRNYWGKVVLGSGLKLSGIRRKAWGGLSGGGGGGYCGRTRINHGRHQRKQEGDIRRAWEDGTWLFGGWADVGGDLFSFGKKLQNRTKLQIISSFRILIEYFEQNLRGFWGGAGGAMLWGLRRDICGRISRLLRFDRDDLGRRPIAGVEGIPEWARADPGGWGKINVRDL